jgi:predicted phosphodiesterase
VLTSVNGSLRLSAAAAMATVGAMRTRELWGRWRRRVARPAAVGLGVLVLAGASVAGGVATTALFPSTVETINYRAALRLSVHGSDVSTIQTPTVFGDIHLGFAGGPPAPGVLASVQVKENIIDLLAQPRISVEALQPGPLELSAAARDAALALGLRFAAGSLAVVVLALTAYALWRHRRPSAGRLAAVAAVWIIAGASTGVSMWQTYQPERLETFRTTSVLGTVQRNADLLAGVETRAQQTAPYLKNLLALSSALQQKYSPHELEGPTAARLLLVSDVHGAQQYPLMRTIIEEEDIDAVLDMGDLLNFGSVAEAEAVGLFDGIASLGVPYLFVGGNHDAMSPDDTAVLDRLARVPNVALLQPAEDTYTVQSINGVRIAGFNDPRWFGDDNRNNAAKQRPAAEAFVRAFADQPVPDIVAAHEPAAVSRIERADLRIHGHMHSHKLDGNLIGVGTFTGGGPFSHFIAEDDGELRGQHSSFDVATFGQGCRLRTLTRYQFRNVIEGRPAYDDVTLINGSRIEGPVEEEKEEAEEPPTSAGEGGATEDAEGDEGPAPRTCERGLGLSSETVSAEP